MKHFLPSSVMLTPFLVKYYDEEPEEEECEQATDGSLQSTAENLEPNQDKYSPES